MDGINGWAWEIERITVETGTIDTRELELSEGAVYGSSVGHGGNKSFHIFEEGSFVVFGNELIVSWA